MTISGISMLASKLQRAQYPPSTMSSVSGVRESANTVEWPNERIKLTDSLATVVKHGAQTLSIEEIREELNNLIGQCRSQEESLLYFHTRFHHQEAVMESLRNQVCARMQGAHELKLKFLFLHAWKYSLRGKKATPTILESMNLNDTLRNLALSLESPTNIDPNASICSNISIPFKIARPHRIR